MTTLEIILSILLYIVFVLITYSKQIKTLELNNYDAPPILAFILALIWPITITWYTIRAVFFEDWI